MTQARERKMLRDIWDDLSEGLISIYDGHNRMPPHRYMELYTHVFNYCSSTNVVPDLAGNRRGPGINDVNRRAPLPPGAEFVGSELYAQLTQFITSQARELNTSLNIEHGETLLQHYTQTWTRFKFGSIVVNGIFSYLNRHWIRREIDEGRNVFEVYNLAIHIWKQVIFDELHHNITSAALALIQQDRKNEMIQTKLIKGVVESYIELGINERDAVDGGDLLGQTANQAGRQSVRYQIYRNFFVNRLLEETRNFYTSESTEFLQDHSVAEYMEKVEGRLKEEVDRCGIYLDHTTQDPLLKTCDDALITQHLEQFHNEFETLLSKRQTEHLGRMFVLCSRVPRALDKLKQVLEMHAVREGKAAIEKISQTASNDPKQYITKILEMYDIYNDLVTVAFKQEHGFVESMDRAFTRFVNENEVTRLAKSASKSPQLLVFYCDQLLRKSAKNVEDEKMDQLLDQVMTVFKYIEDKDMFQAFYHKMLCKRLVTESSASEEAERSMIAKLKHMCGFEYTSKLERLLTDVSISRDNTEAFRRQNTGGNNVDFSVIVIMSNVWPLTQPIKFEIPAPLMDCIDGFKNYYSGKYNGRKLNWVLQMSRGELTSVPQTFDQKYSFLCNTQQISVLMLYNQQDSYTMAEIVTQLNLARDQLLPVLQSLLKVNMLSAESDAADELTDDSTLSFNAGFTNKKLKVDLLRAMSTSKETKKDSDDVQKSVDEDRKIVIQAAIVRIMKMRKTLNHQQLIGEVLNQLTARFQPKIPLVKKCIDLLIEKEYLKRAEQERDTYEYLA